MKKYFSISAVLLFLLGIVFQPVSLAQQPHEKPESRVASFYSWFIRNDTDHSYPLNLPDIHKYLAKDTIDRLRDDYSHGGPPGGIDYFLKVQDYDEHDWLAHTSVQPAITLGSVVVVPVTFGSSDKVSVLVFLRKQDGDWKITKIDDTRDYL